MEISEYIIDFIKILSLNMDTVLTVILSELAVWGIVMGALQTLKTYDKLSQGQIYLGFDLGDYYFYHYFQEKNKVFKYFLNKSV